jgi:tyrosyl-tRNA synthetase
VRSYPAREERVKAIVTRRGDRPEAAPRLALPDDRAHSLREESARRRSGESGVSRTLPVDLSLLERSLESVYSDAEFKQKLALGRPLRIKYGVDVTGPLLHIGHAVNLWMMRALQECGHVVVLLIGDFTTRIGDPTGKSQTRRQIDRSDIEANSSRFLEQVGRILLKDPEVFEIRRNTEWYDRMSLDGFMGLLSMVTHSRLIQRDMFQKRIAEQSEIHMHEILYPVLQGYDSVELDSDLTIVGTDQLFNELMGRFFQERLGKAPQVVMTTRITPGTDGVEKQSKSLGNYIAIDDTPRDKFGKIMSIPDFLIVPYLEVYTTVPLDEAASLARGLEAGTLNPKHAKQRLASAIVDRYHGAEAAAAEARWFEETFSRRETPADVSRVRVERGAKLLAVLQACMPSESKTALRRLVEEGAVRVGERKLEDPDAPLDLEPAAVLRVGKRRWYSIEYD